MRTAGTGTSGSTLQIAFLMLSAIIAGDCVVRTSNPPVLSLRYQYGMYTIIGSGLDKETVRAFPTTPITVNGSSFISPARWNGCPIGFLPGHRVLAVSSETTA